MPSDHVCSRLELPPPPQVPNQEPPRPQQLILPDLPMAPHFGHAELMIVVVMAVSVNIVTIGTIVVTVIIVVCTVVVIVIITCIIF